jgi:hypothetical protein
MAIMEVLLRQRYYEQECLNRFHYIGAGTPAAVSLSFALADALGFIYTGTAPTSAAGTLFGWLRSLQAIAVEYVEVQIRDLYSETDFYLRPFVAGTHGVVDNEPQSPVLAYGFNSNRITTVVRRGQKRFVGVDDSTVDDGGGITSSWLTTMNGVADEMSAVQTYDDEGNTLTFTPAVLSLEKYTAPSGKPAYRPYASASVQLAHAAVGVNWSAKETVRSQTSRQYGHGR